MIHHGKYTNFAPTKEDIERWNEQDKKAELEVIIMNTVLTC